MAVTQQDIPAPAALAVAAQPWWVRKATRVKTFESLANPHFRLLWFGMLASYLAMNVNIFARGILALDLSGSATALGFVTMVRGLPQLFLSPIGGVIADRVDKRKLLIITQMMMGTIAVINVVLIATGLIEIWHLALLSLIEGFIFAFNMPSRQAIVPELVSDEELTNAVALNNSGMNLTRILGPAMGGVLLGFGARGMELAFLAVALCYCGFTFALYKLPRERRVTRPKKAPFVQQLTGGVKYIFATPALLALMGLAFIPILFGQPYQTLLPVFGREVYHISDGQIGLLSAASGLGALVGSLVVASLGAFPRKSLLQAGFGVVFGVTLVGLALTPMYGAALVWVFFVGLCGNAYMSLNSTMIMSTTDRAYHGRVMSVYMMTWSLMPLSTLPIGTAVDTFGVQPTVAVAGVLVTLFIGVIGLGRSRRAAAVPSPAAGD